MQYVFKPNSWLRPAWDWTGGIPELQTDRLDFNMVKNVWPEGF